MRLKRETKAISALIAILLILLSAIVSALIVYMWVMAPFYLEPGDTVDLVVTNVNFPVDHARYFDLTLMNPSHSISGTNITDIYVTAEGFDKTSIRASEPAIPVVLDKGTTQTFNCSLDWGAMAGKIITVHVLTSNNTEAARSVTTQLVSLELSTTFDPAETVQQFNASVAIGSSPINLTLSSVLLNLNSINNLSIAPLPYSIPANQSVSFTCYANWEGLVKPLISIETREGYKAETRQDMNGTLNLQITGVTFNETHPDQMSVSIFNSPDSSSYVNISKITVTHSNLTTIVTGDLSTPSLPQKIGTNQTLTFAFAWNWTDVGFRNVDMTLVAYTVQGFTPVTRTFRTPAMSEAVINEVYFNLTDTGIFNVNITNKGYSLQTINVTGIDLNQQSANITSTLIDPGAKATLTCEYNWSSLVGQDVTITAHIKYDSYESLISYNLRLQYFEITNVTFSSFSPETAYINVTVRNSEFSPTNATITQVYVKAGNTTAQITNPAGYNITKGCEFAIVVPYNWNPYVGQDITITVQSIDGFQASSTSQVA